MRVYLAAPYAARELVAAYANDLRELGIDCMSSWLEESHEITAGTVGPAADLDDATVSDHAQTDLEDVGCCDVLVLFTAAFLNMSAAQAASGGRHVETGYALARGKQVIVVGQPENVFHRILNGAVVLAPTWRRALNALVVIQRDLQAGQPQEASR